MLFQLMKVNSEQEDIIVRQAHIINELFILLCQHINYDDFEGLKPLLNNMMDITERKEDAGCN